MEIIILVVLVILGGIGKIINMIIHKKDETKINFDEFDDIEKIKQQEIKDKKELEYESEVLNHVYNDSYNKSIQDSIDNRNFHRKNNYSDEVKSYDLIKAHLDAQEDLEKAKRDLYNFKVIDAIEVEEDIAEGNPISALRENGYNFDVQLFKKWSRQIFGCIKSGTEEQLKIAKNFMSEELYDRLEYQMNQFAKDGLDFVTEDLLIEKCILHDYSKSMSKEEIKILIDATMKEYIIQKDSNKILRGSNKKSYKKRIIMTFLKKDIEEAEGLIHNCPNCGAEVVQTEFGKCRYCNTLVVPIRYNWTLTKFETL